MMSMIQLPNWRRPLIFGLMRLTGSPIPTELNLLRSVERLPRKQVLEHQERRLSRLLLHAWENTEYYKKILSECGVVRNGEVNLSRFEQIPPLTKDIIRREGERLKAKRLPKGRIYPNSSGGSTGQPTQFWQDTHYWDLNIATKLYHFEVMGKEVGDPEMKIWGSPEDLFKGTIGVRAKLKNFLYNRKLEPCFHLPDERIETIIHDINRFKPKIIWSYLDAVYVVAQYLIRNDLSTHKPRAIFVGASTLYPHIVTTIEKALRAPVINFYGSRELGDVACQCEEQEGLHIAALLNKVETIDTEGNPIRETEGELVITALMNYGMPFIRYRLGDRGTLTSETCPCGRGYPLLKSVAGRVIEVFMNDQGERVDSYYFIHLISVVFNFSFVKKFQVIQEDYAKITIKLILYPGYTLEQVSPELDRLTEKIRLVMGSHCEVYYEYVDDIPPTKTGKHLYTVRKVPLPEEQTAVDTRPNRMVSGNLR